MELTVTYILSQVFTIIMYALLGVTYYTKERKKILIISILSNASCGIAYVLLQAWSGFAMCLLAIFRESVNLFEEKKNGKRDYINKFDIVFLIILYAICIISAVFTYEGFLSLLSIIATMIYTFAICQKSTKVYKICGIPISTLWIIYNAYVKSIFGVILESIILICSITGYILEARKKKCVEN
jgi:hypothetical protein